MQGEDARLIDWATQQDQVWEWVTSDAHRHGCSARDSALEWAKAASGDHSWWEAAGSLAVALVNSEEQRAPLNDYFEAVISLMEDPDFPLWLRAALALKEYDLATFWFPLEFSTWSDDATEYSRIHRLVERYHAANVMIWDQYPWPGYIDIPESEIANDNTLPFRWSMAFDDQFPIGETQIEWCRKMLYKPTCRGRTLGIVLRKLMDSGELRVEDLNSLAPQWRSRFLRNIAEEKYTFLPAVAVFGIALANFEIPGREKLFDHIRAQRHKPHIEDTVYSPLSGWYGTTEEITEVWERAIGSEWVPMAVRLGACMGKSHILGISFEEACDQAFRESGGNTDFVELAGCFSPSYERHLWHGLSMRSTELHRRIEAIA
ncbi:MAG: hypothetical protein Q4C87_09615, partial [Actinomycetaceae bacterium]|nr:hypothetical protein [Actinomycetaceae bacterium]